MTNNNWEEEFIEKGAALEHDRWAKWQKWMHGRVYDSSKSINPHLKVIPTEDFNRWERQIATEYEQLSDKEKESDRIEVRKYLPLIQDLLTKKDQEHKVELEIIKGEAIKPGSIYPIDEGVNLNPVQAFLDGYTKSRNDYLAILDSHINKLSTE